MTKCRLRTRVALVFGIVVFTAGGAANAQDGAAAWKGGKMYVPASLSISGVCDSESGGTCAAFIKPGKHPVIVYLHGCGGLRTPRTFLDLGAIVIAPDSFAGGGGCKPDAAHMLSLVNARYADVSHAVGQIQAAAWADPDKLVLAGFSNGGQVTASYPGSEFKARVIVAWTCNNPRAPSQNGVRGSGPALAVLGTADDFYRKIGISGDCGSALADRAGSRSVLIEGGTHEILDHADTRVAVSGFVRSVIQ
jgi:dienelactone hydrolase